MNVAAIIVAAGRGSRAGGAVPKQYRTLAGRSVLARALVPFLAAPDVKIIQPVIGEGDEALFRTALAKDADLGKLRPAVSGGTTRQESVKRGLEAIADARPDLVLVHDAARPFVSSALLERAIAAGHHWRAAVPGMTPSDTIKIVDEAERVVATPERTALRAIQTPQAFAFAELLDAHRRAAHAGLMSFPDDGALAEWAGLSVTVFEGDLGNVKLTYERDFVEAERRLAGSERARAWLFRVGTGFDVHAFGGGDHLWLGGIRIPADRGVVAHSDGDVVLHALTDALLGAIADGDIGVHFPPSDPQWRGASSDQFLAFATERVRARGGVIDNLDVTVLCESPRIGPYRDAMRQRIAAIANIPEGAVSLKATTTERLGFIGRREGLAAQAIAAVRLPLETA